jgi:hypothetical protein
MRSLHNSSFDPQTLVLLETAFDEAWLTLKSVGNKTVKPCCTFDRTPSALQFSRIPSVERGSLSLRLIFDAINGLAI